MEKDNKQIAIDKLIAIADQNGYVLFDDVSDVADAYSLSLSDIDWLSNELSTRGIILYEEKPQEVVKNADEYSDYSQIDYETVYEEIIEIDQSLTSFVNEVKKIIPAQYGEIGKLKYQVYDGNNYARERLIEIHIRGALKIALQRSQKYDTDLEEAIGDACIGLTIAADKYNPDENGPFGSYANMWMLQCIARNQPTRCTLIYYPVYKKELYFDCYCLLKEHDLITDLGVDDLDYAMQLLEAEMHVSKEETKEIIEESTPVLSLDSLRNIFKIKNKDKLLPEIDRLKDEIVDYITNNNIYSDPETILLEKEQKNMVLNMLDILSDREKDIIKLRYGINCEKPYTLEEIGNKYNLTRERIRQIEKRAFLKLKAIYGNKHSEKTNPHQ